VRYSIRQVIVHFGCGVNMVSPDSTSFAAYVERGESVGLGSIQQQIECLESRIQQEGGVIVLRSKGLTFLLQC